MKTVKCPKCGEKVKVQGLGRPRLGISLIKVTEALQKHGNVDQAAEELGCSQAYIFAALKTNHLKVKDVIMGVTIADVAGCSKP
jgi:molybdenum-dependent DNA-binding transcriptional regulator ModE